MADRWKLTALGNRELVTLLFVSDGHVGEGDGVVIRSVAGLAKSLHAGLYDLLHGGAGGLQVVARVELTRVLGEGLADGAGRGEAQVCVHVYLAHAVLDALLNLVNRHAPSRADLPTVPVNDVDEFLGHAGGAVHDE